MLHHPSTAAVVVALLLHAALFAIPAVRHSAAPPQALHAVAMDLRLEPEHAPAHPPPEPQKPEEPPPPPQTEQPENPPPPPAQPAAPVPPPQQQPSPAPAPVAPAPARPKPADQPPVREKAARPSPSVPALPAARPAPAPQPAATPGYQTASAPAPLRQPSPAYPSECRRLKQSGTVMLILFINESGTVDRAEVSRSSGFAALDAAAVSAVKRWTFLPPVINGHPAKSRAQVPCTFSLK